MTTSPADTGDALRVKVRSPAQLLAAIPYQFGFHPSNSLVAGSVKGSRQQLAFSLRADLLPVEHDEQVARYVVARLAYEGAQSALLIVYASVEEQPAHGERLPRQHLFAALQRHLDAAAIQIREALCVQAGRWWSYVCVDPRCCPPVGTPLIADTEPGGESEIAATSRLAGLVALPDRDALAATIAPVGFLVRRGMEQALQRVEGELVDAIAAGAGGLEQFREESRRLLADAREVRPDGRAALTDAQAARLIVGLADVAVRDWCIQSSGGRPIDPAHTLWAELTHRAVPPYGAAPATLLAWSAYAEGHGALARVALDRALDDDPAYRLAGYLSEALDRGIPPAAVRRAAVAAFAEPAAGRSRRSRSGGARPARPPGPRKRRR